MIEDPATLWHSTSPQASRFPALSGLVEADLAIVGGGFAGLSTALHAVKAGLSVVLIEAAQIAWGASGRNAGFVVPNFAKVDPDDVRARYPDKAEALVAMAAGSSDLVFRLIREAGIDCAAVQSGWIQPSHSPQVLAKAKERVRQWSALGRPVEYLDAAAIQQLTGVQGWLGGWIDRSGGVINPVAYARGLGRVVAGFGARVAIHEQTPALALAPRNGGWQITTPQGGITARRVVLATNAYAGGIWPDLARSFFPLKVFQVATRPLPASVRSRLLPQGQCVSDSRRNLFTFRFDAANRLISGGMHVLSPGADTRVPRAIHRRLGQMLDLPDLPPLEYSWSGLASVMPDFLPRVSLLAPGLLAGFACNGRGIALSTAMGAELARWGAGADAGSLALPLHRAAPIPLHALARLAPNALLPLGIVKDQLDIWRARR